jgi:hypothetical protein
VTSGSPGVGGGTGAALGAGAGVLYFDSPGAFKGSKSSAGCIDFFGVGLEIGISGVEAFDGLMVSPATGPRAGAALAAGSGSGSFSFYFSFFVSFGASFSSAFSSGSSSLVLLSFASFVIFRS